MTLSSQSLLTLIQLRAYVHQKLSSGGIHSSGALSDFDWFTLSVTAQSCGPSMSLAKASRLAVVQVEAPDCAVSGG